MVSVVLFQTPRLVVRELAEGDAGDLFRIYGDPAVVRWMGDGKPLKYELCAKWIDVSQRNYATKGFGASALTLRETGDFIGLCGIVYAPDRDEPEIVYGFDPHYWGQGFASEVVPPMLRYGINDCRLPRILATIDSKNFGSVRVAEKAGMRLERTENNDDGSSTLVYVYP